MITNLTDFNLGYNVKDGEFASAAVLSRPSNRIKTEFNNLGSLAFSAILGDNTLIPVYSLTETYEKDIVVQKDSEIYISKLATFNEAPDMTPAKWLNITSKLSSISSGGGFEYVLGFETLLTFPVSGSENTIYIDYSENTLYYWNGTIYTKLTSGSSSSLVMGVEEFISTEAQTVFTIEGSTDNGVIVFVDGMLKHQSEYILDELAKTITLVTPLTAGKIVQIGSTTTSLITAGGYVPATRYEYVSTNAQTVFSANYVVGNVDVFRNGIKLASSDFTANTGSTIVLLSGATTGDLIEVISYSAYDPALLVMKSGSTMIGPLSSLRLSSNVVTLSNLDLSQGNYFSKTITKDTTFSLSNIPASGQYFTFLLEIVNGNSFTTNLWNNIIWEGGVAPVLTTTGKDILEFITVNGGLTWMGFKKALDIK